MAAARALRISDVTHVVPQQLSRPKLISPQHTPHRNLGTPYEHPQLLRDQKRRKRAFAASLTPRAVHAVAAATSLPTGEERLPESREEAIYQACAAIEANLPKTATKSSGKKGKASKAAGGTDATVGFTSAGRKLSVEIPVRDESEPAALELARDILKGLPAIWRKQFTVIATAQPSAARAMPGLTVTTLQECLEHGPPGNCLMILAPSTAQIGQVEEVMGAWRGPAAVLINAEWASHGGEDDCGVPSPHAAFARSFDAVYCFMPIVIKAFVIATQEGAVFRLDKGMGTSRGGRSQSGFSGGASDGEGRAPWRVFMLKNKEWEPVARMNRRPSSTDVEVAFLNSQAADSPLTTGAKFLRGLTQKK